MQLTDDEIREILIKRKKKERRRRRKRRRVTLLVFVLIVVCAAAAAVIHFRNGEAGAGVLPSKGTIFIDPGHGGSDPGSASGGRNEKDDNLVLAMAVKKALNRKGFRVIMSRTEDETVGRTRRGELANECGAQLMISLHRNKSNGKGKGVEVFVPTDGSPDSQLLGMNIFDALINCGFEERSIRTGTLNSEKEDYEELAAAEIPCCLVEVGFIDNKEDNKLFDENLKQNAKAIAGSIDDTFTEIYEPEQEQAN
jgi:N-acetylmuramoyl-L-alanine amidase